MTLDPDAESRSSSEISFLQSAISKVPPFQIYQRTLENRIIFNGKKTAVREVNSCGWSDRSSRKEGPEAKTLGLFN